MVEKMCSDRELEEPPEVCWPKPAPGVEEGGVKVGVGGVGAGVPSSAPAVEGVLAFGECVGDCDPAALPLLSP